MERVPVDGTTLEYEVTGDGEPVVFIHGALIADAFQPLVAEPALCSRYQLITYHRRGYVGSSHTQRSITLSRQAEDCLGLLHHLGVNRAHVVGHSFGGCIALQLALEAPEVVHSLGLLEPALIVGANAQGYREALAGATQRYREAGAEVAVDEFWQPRFGPGYRAWLDRVLPGAFAQEMADAGTWFELEASTVPDWSFDEVAARRITQPALVVLGSESDALWSRFGETYRLLLNWLPRAEGFVLPGATHGLQLQNPQGIARALADFFGRHPIRS